MLEPTVKRINPWRALFRVLTDPWSTFQELGGRPAVLPGYLLQVLAGLIVFALMMPLTNQMIADQMAAAAAANPAAQVTSQQAAMAKNIALATSGGGAVLQPWVAGLVVALIASFMGQFAGGSAGFSAYFGMAGYARMPLVLNNLLQGVLISQAGSAAEATNMSLSLAAFLPADASAYLKALLGFLNPFSIWYYILLAFGFAALHRTKPAKGASFAGAILFLNLVVTLAGAALQSAAPGM